DQSPVVGTVVAGPASTWSASSRLMASPAPITAMHTTAAAATNHRARAFDGEATGMSSATGAGRCTSSSESAGATSSMYCLIWLPRSDIFGHPQGMAELLQPARQIRLDRRGGQLSELGDLPERPAVPLDEHDGQALTF